MLHTITPLISSQNLVNSPILLCVNLKAIANNYLKIKAIVGGVNVAAVVKADSYGIGATEIAKTLQEVGCNDFAVVHVDEGVALRAILPQANIYLFLGFILGTEDLIKEHNLTPILNSKDQLLKWREVARDHPAIIQFDTGMKRNGFDEYETEFLINNQELLEGMNIKYYMSHLTASEDSSSPSNEAQKNYFDDITSKLPDKPKTFANSGGVFLGQDYHYQMVRPGIALYGGNPSQKFSENPMENVIFLYAKILEIHIHKNGAVGYNGTHSLVRNTRIATIAIGYADGYLRHFSNKSYVMIAGYKANILGRVSMDFITVDVTDIPEELAHVGGYAEIIGNHITIDDLANMSGTVSYEVITNLGNRFKKLYV